MLVLQISLLVSLLEKHTVQRESAFQPDGRSPLGIKHPGHHVLNERSKDSLTASHQSKEENMKIWSDPEGKSGAFLPGPVSTCRR